MKKYCCCRLILLYACSVVFVHQLLFAVEAPQFSISRGFFKTNFEAVVSSATASAVIKYTLDGSDPRFSLTAIQKTSPATITIDPESVEGGRGKTPGVVLRACAVVSDSAFSETVTHTYLFAEMAAALSPRGVKPAANWPDPTTAASPQAFDYGMDSAVVNDPRYKDVIDDALLAIPTISVATDLKHLFNADSGIYVNAYNDGREWERPASIELINPDGSVGFQINAGIRIRGGASRSGTNPKHSFRFFFRSEYGKSKLEFPLFEKEGVSSFDKIDLRTGQNYSWSFPDHLGQYNTMITEVFSRDLMREMGQPYTRSRFYHLYINGVYWGLYQTEERPEARFAESYFGGKKSDYDVIKDGDGWPASIEATDGDTVGYLQLWDACKAGFSTNENYFKLLGMNPDGTNNPAYKVLVDVDNLIDYMLVIFYTGNFDSPITKFYNNNSPNNLYAIYNRNGNNGFRFVARDAEHSLRTTAGEGPGIGLYENRVNIGTVASSYKMVVTEFSKFHPQWLHFKLSDNLEYRIRFMDHVYRHMFNQGCMTSEKAIALFLSRAKEIETAIIGESARWGDTYSAAPRTKDDDWQPAIDDIVYNYFPVRTAIVLSQLRSAGLYTNAPPPSFKHRNEEILFRVVCAQPGYTVKLKKETQADGAIVQYTLDGKDPREIGGTIASSATSISDSAEVTINTTTVVKARTKVGTNWSALREVTIIVENSANDLKVTEIHYHPLDSGSVSNSEYEFLEMKNIGKAPIDLSGVVFTNGITYTFPAGAAIEPGKFIVLCSNLQEFKNRYSVIPFGEYSGQLDNSGEQITVCTAGGDTIFNILYDDQAPWPVTPDGDGYSLTTKETNPTGNLNDPSNWRASIAVHGSPGEDDVVTDVGQFQSLLVPEFYLKQNYPNPFNPTTTFSFAIPVSAYTTLKIYDVVGREVATIVQEQLPAGNYVREWNGESLSSGIYFYHIQSGKFSATRKLLLLK